MFLSFICFIAYKFCINVTGPTSMGFQYIKPDGNQESILPLSSSSYSKISYETNIPFKYEFIFNGCRFSQAGENTNNKICPKVNENYLQNICNYGAFPLYLEKTYVNVKNDIEYENVQLFIFINSKYTEISKGENSIWANTISYFTVELFVKSNLCTQYIKIGTLNSYSDRNSEIRVTNNHIPEKCYKSSTYYLKVKNNLEDGYQLFALNSGNYEKISNGETYSKIAQSEFTISFFIKSSKCQTYTSIGDVTATINEEIRTISINDIPNECKVYDGGDSDGPCLSNGKIYYIQNQMYVTVQSNFKNQCPNAEKLIIKGAQTITFQSGEAFKNSKLKLIEMSSSTSISIQSNVFENMASLNSLSLTSQTVTVQGTAFKGTGLSEISLSGSISVSIQGSAFRSCKSLNTVNLAGMTVTVQGLTFSHCTSLRSFTIKASSSATIQSNAFCGCENLNKDSININANIINVDQNAFSCDKDDGGDDGDDGGDSDALEPIKYIFPARKNGQLRPIEITIVDEEGSPKIDYAKQLLEVLPIKIYSKIDDNTNLNKFNIVINYDKSKFLVDKSNLPSKISSLVVENDINNGKSGKKGVSIVMVAGIIAVVVVVIVIVIVVVVVVTKKKSKNERTSTTTGQIMMTELLSKN